MLVEASSHSGYQQDSRGVLVEGGMRRTLVKSYVQYEFMLVGRSLHQIELGIVIHRGCGSIELTVGHFDIFTTLVLLPMYFVFIVPNIH